MDRIYRIAAAATLRYLCDLLFKPKARIPHGVSDSVDRQVGDRPYNLSK